MFDHTFPHGHSLLLFFLFERVINRVGEWREGRARKARAAAGSRAGSLKAGNAKSSGDSDVMEEKVMIVRSGHRNSDMVVGEKLCKSKYSPYCVDDIEDVEAAQQVDQNASKVPSSSGMAPLLSHCSLRFLIAKKKK